MEKPKIFNEYNTLIRENPEIMSLLYDLDFLPEQLKENTKEWLKMLLIIGAMSEILTERDACKQKLSTTSKALREIAESKVYNDNMCCYERTQESSIAHEALLKIGEYKNNCASKKERKKARAARQAATEDKLKIAIEALERVYEESDEACMYSGEISCRTIHGLCRHLSKEALQKIGERK